MFAKIFPPKNKRLDKEKEMYDTDIETLSTEIIQMILWNRIIYSDEDGVDIRTKELLEENKKQKTLKIQF